MFLINTCFHSASYLILLRRAGVVENWRTEKGVGKNSIKQFMRLYLFPMDVNYLELELLSAKRGFTSETNRDFFFQNTYKIMAGS